MRHIKLTMIVIVAASLMLPGFDVVSARGGGGRGGWSGGRGGHGGGGGWGWGIAGAAIAGVLIGAAAQPQTVIVEQQYAPSALPYGTEITTLPPGCVSQNVNGTIVYQCGPVWYRPLFGSNGVYYEVVPPPSQGMPQYQ